MLPITTDVAPSPTSAVQVIPNLDRSTELGLLLLPLIEELRTIPGTLEGKTETLEWKQAALPLMRKHIEGKDLSSLTFPSAEQLFLMSDPAANEARRILLHSWASQRLLRYLSDNSAELSVEDIKQITNVATLVTKLGYSRFMGDRAMVEKFDPETISNLLIKPNEIQEIVSQSFTLSAEASGLLALFDFEFARECKSLCQVTDNDWGDLRKTQKMYTDPGHLWLNLVMDYRIFFWGHKNKDDIKEVRNLLLMPTAFMILEDNQLHKWNFSHLRSIKNAIFYGPSSSSQDQNIRTALREPPCYGWARDAITDINEALECGFHLPNVIVCDIELFDKDQNGLDFVEWLDARLREEDRRNEVSIVMVYSSNLNAYSERIASIKDRGCIEDAVQKKDFNLAELIKLVAKEQVESIH